jgi:hypothetical protein
VAVAACGGDDYDEDVEGALAHEPTNHTSPSYLQDVERGRQKLQDDFNAEHSRKVIHGV